MRRKWLCCRDLMYVFLMIDMTRLSRYGPIQKAHLSSAAHFRIIWSVRPVSVLSVVCASCLCPVCPVCGLCVLSLSCLWSVDCASCLCPVCGLCVLSLSCLWSVRHVSVPSVVCTSSVHDMLFLKSLSEDG